MDLKEYAVKRLVSKLYGGGTANRVVQTVDGLAMVMGQVATDMIAANAVTQVGVATGSTSSPSTTSTSYSDVPEMSVTLTTTGGDLLVWFNATATMEGSSIAGSFALSLDGASEVAPRVFQQDNAVTYALLAIQHRFTGVSAGSHTVKVRYLTNNASAPCKAYSTQRALMVMELKR